MAITATNSFAQYTSGTVDLVATDIYVDNRCQLFVKRHNAGTLKHTATQKETIWLDGVVLFSANHTQDINPGAGNWVAYSPMNHVLSGTSVVRYEVDVDNVVNESNERNNKIRKRLRCNKSLKSKS